MHYDMNERLGHTHPDMPPVGAFILKTCGGATLSRLQIRTLLEARAINQTTYPSAEFLFAATQAFQDYIQEVPGYLEKMNRRVTPGEMISVICSYTMKGYGWLEYAAAHRVSDHSEGEKWTSSL